MATHRQHQSSRRSLRRVIVRIGVGFLLLLVVGAVVGWFVLTRTGVLGSMIAPALSERIGGDVIIGSATVTGTRVATLEDVTLRSREFAGEPGELVHAGEIIVRTDLVQLARGIQPDMEVTLRDARFRLSEDASNPGTFTFMSLSPPPTEEAGPPTTTIINVERSVVEVGTFEGGAFHRAGTLYVSGTFRATRDDPDWMYFELNETDASGNLVGTDSLRFKGRLNTRTLASEGRVDGLLFEDRIFQLMPLIVRSWWEQLELAGQVSNAAIEFTPEGRIWAKMDVDAVALTIPFLADGIWARFDGTNSIDGHGLPRMHVEAGSIELIDEQIRFHDLKGQLTSTADDPSLAGVPYRVNGTLGPVPEFVWEQDQWTEGVLAYSPIDLTFYLDGFAFDAQSGGLNSAVELPQVITRILAQFNLNKFVLDTNIKVSRAAPASGDDGAWIAEPLRSSGRATLSDGRGAYSRFPYPIRNVSAQLRFDQDSVDVVSLLGEGGQGGRVSLGGRIAPISKWPGVQLHISGENLPINDDLRDAMSDQFEGVMEAIMHEPSFEALKAGAGWPNAERRREREQEAIDLVRRRAQLENDVQSGVRSEVETAELLHDLDQRIGSLHRLLDHPPFEMGGTVNFELTVSREPGREQETTTTGDIEVASAGFVLSRFPYPIQVSRGTITLERDRAIVRDFFGVAPGGGLVLINGEVRTASVEDEDGNESLVISPDIRFGIIDDILNPTLGEAIALVGRNARRDAGASDAEHGDSALEMAGGLLRAAGLSGMVSCDGRITNDAAGNIDWNIAVLIDDGQAQPDQALADAMNAVGLLWPAGFSLSNVTGSFRLLRDRIDIASLSGRRGDGTVTASGVVEVGGDTPRTAIDVAFRSFELEEYLLNLFPAEGIARARSFWDRYQPQGSFDADLRYETVDFRPLPLELAVRPKRVLLTVAGEPVAVEGDEAGSAILRLSERGITFENVRLRLSSANGEDGTVTLTGRYGPSDDAASGVQNVALHGAITDGRFESPWVVEAFDLVDQPDALALYHQLAPKGRFDGSFAFEPGEDGTMLASVTVLPHDLDVMVDEMRLSAALREGSTVVVSDGRIAIEDVSGQFADGSAFAVLGEINLRDGVDADLQVSFRGRGISDELRSVLPEALIDGLAAIDFAIEDEIVIEDAAVRMHRDGTAEDGDGRWVRSFVGTVHVAGASFNAGMRFDAIHGALHIDAGRTGDEPVRLRMDIDAPSARIEERILRNVKGTLTLNEQGDALLLPDLSAECYDGVISANATTEFGEGGVYEVNLDLVGVNLNAFANARQTRAADSSVSSAAESSAEGALYGHVALHGERGRPEMTRGRGSVRILDGRIASNPITLPLLQLTNLMLPLDASLAYAESTFYILADHVIFEEVLLESDRILLLGDGGMNLNTYEVDVRLRSRGRVVGLSDLLAGLNDQIFAIHVTGPLDDTSARLVPLPSLGGFYKEDWVERFQNRSGTVTHVIERGGR